MLVGRNSDLIYFTAMTMYDWPLTWLQNDKMMLWNHYSFPNSVSETSLNSERIATMFSLLQL